MSCFKILYFNIHYTLIIIPAFGSKETDSVKSETMFNSGGLPSAASLGREAKNRDSPLRVKTWI